MNRDLKYAFYEAAEQVNGVVFRLTYKYNLLLNSHQLSEQDTAAFQEYFARIQELAPILGNAPKKFDE